MVHDKALVTRKDAVEVVHASLAKADQGLNPLKAKDVTTTSLQWLISEASATWSLLYCEAITQKSA